MGKGDKETEIPKKDSEKSLGGPFEQPPAENRSIADIAGLVTSKNSPDCKAVYQSKKGADEVDAVTFDSCYHGKTNSKGKSLEMKVPVMQPGADGIPRPKIENITTEGITMDSRRLDVFVHALPAVRPVSFENGEVKAAGTAAMIAEDGLMITNKHVVDGSNGTLQVKLLLPDGSEETRNATVVKVNPKQDLALLQVDRKANETFPALPISKRTDWREREPLVEIGNANGEGKISMAKARYSSMLNQSEIPFQTQPGEVVQGRTMYSLSSVVPQGYSGGVVLSIPGSHRNATGVQRDGTSAIRGITDYSNLTNKAYIIPAARVQFMLDEYRKEQAAKSAKK